MINDSIKRLIWNRSTRPIVGYDINYYGLDYLNNVIKFNDFGNRDSLYGWELDHILPKSLGGLDVISNLRALHWQSNASLGGHFGKLFQPWKRSEIKSYMDSKKQELMMEMTEVCGVSGNRYALEVYPVWTQFKALAGVYMFFKPRSLSPSRCLLNQPLGIWDILYIGETEDFNRRLYQQLMEHHKYQYITQKGATHIALLALSGCKEEQRKWIESDLINYYIPSGNAQM